MIEGLSVESVLVGIFVAVMFYTIVASVFEAIKIVRKKRQEKREKNTSVDSQ